MDDDMGDNAFVDKVNPDEHSTKKQRLDELKEILAEAFTMDVADMDEQKGSEKLPPSLSSSSSSSQGGSPSTRSPHTKIGWANHSLNGRGGHVHSFDTDTKLS